MYYVYRNGPYFVEDVAHHSVVVRDTHSGNRLPRLESQLCTQWLSDLGQVT